MTTSISSDPLSDLRQIYGKQKVEKVRKKIKSRTFNNYKILLHLRLL